MKRIFADQFDRAWYSVFIDLAELIGGKSYPQFIAETEPMLADIVIVNSFEDIIAFEELYGSLNINNRVIQFIVSTTGSCNKNVGAENFLPINDSLCFCDFEKIAEYITSIVTPYVIQRETMLKEKPPRIFVNGISAMDDFLQDLEPNFNDGCGSDGE